MLDKLQGRNGSREFALRFMKNLKFVFGCGPGEGDVHSVVQTISALLGIVCSLGKRVHSMSVPVSGRTE